VDSLDRPVKKNLSITNGRAGPAPPLTRRPAQPILYVLPRPLRRGRRASLGGRLCVQPRTGLSGGRSNSWAARRTTRRSWLWSSPDWTMAFSGSWNLARSGSVAGPGSRASCASGGSAVRRSSTTCPAPVDRGLRTWTATERGERSPTFGGRITGASEWQAPSSSNRRPEIISGSHNVALWPSSARRGHIHPVKPSVNVTEAGIIAPSPMLPGGRNAPPGVRSV
jgi:hypothetical protein